MMRFDEIEKKHGSSPVVTDDPSHKGSGTLILDREKSQAVLLSENALRSTSDDKGWFRLRLKGPSGQPILLHNALLSSSIQYTSQHGRMYEEHIYPNAVILGSDALLPGYKVQTIAFTMKELGVFFNYQHVESHSLFEPAKSVVDALKSLREVNDLTYDLFEPREVFVVHHFPKVLSFEVDGHRYEIFIGSKQSGLEWDKIDFQTDPIATIQFAEPLDIDEAMNLAWQWKRYFEQLALRPIPWTSLTARSGTDRSLREADFYLPNHDSNSTEGRHPFTLWPGEIPLNSWTERTTLASVMQKWIELEGERSRLRSAVQSISRNLRRRTSLDDIVTLCAGVESLVELRGVPALSSAQTRVIADGAIAVAKANGIDIEDARLRGVIGSLQNQSLGQRLKLMFTSLEPFITKAQAKTLIASVMALRQIAAHGLSPAADVMPKTSPTVEGFACACALYDLVTCGMPVKSAFDHHVGLLKHATLTILELENVQNEARRPA